MMEFPITSMTPEERLYAYSQSSQIEGQTGCIGYLRGDFGAGQEFYTSWFDRRKEYKDGEFKAEFDEVVNALREKDGLLCSRDSMNRFCFQHPEAEFEGNYCTEYGFKVQTPQHTYMLRCNPNYGDYNFYLYAYVARFLEHHMEKAKEGIRFMASSGRELFRIPDGDHIRIQRSDGSHVDRSCRYIDECHVEIGGGWNNLYHVFQFAEVMERNGSTVIPLRSSLPEHCYIYLPTTREIGIVKKGESGYYRSDLTPVYGEDGKQFVEELNQKGGITKAQEAAMLAGSMFGWQTPAADPKNYDEQGQPIKRKTKDRGEAR